MEWFRRFMYGRYGQDHLSVFLLAVYLVLYILSSLLRWSLLSWVALLPAFFAVYRMFSKNIPRRRAENARFLSLVSPVTRWLRMRRTIRHDKDHRYFKCPSCGQQLRVPRGKGKITVTCRSCGASFEENS